MNRLLIRTSSLINLRRANATKTDPLFRLYKYASSTPVVPKVLITGGLGQLGKSLALVLQAIYGHDSVIVTDIGKRPDYLKDVPFCYLNILDKNSIEEVIVNNNIDTVVHFSALLSAVGENNVPMALQVNSLGVQHVLEVCRAHQLKVFIPSTIGAFGPTTPRDHTPDLTVQRPRTIYGVTKVYAELLGEYYFERFGLDFRSLRFPGIISAIQPGGGTTDYAIQIFFDALTSGKHMCYLRPDTMLPMMYDTDCMSSVIQILAAPSESLSMRTYNVTGFSFTPEDIATEIRRYIPHFQIEYNPCPIRQKIADSWPRSLDDSSAREDWGWNPEHNLASTTRLMLELVEGKLEKTPKNTPIQAQL